MPENKDQQYDWTNMIMLMSAASMLILGFVLAVFESYDDTVMILTMLSLMLFCMNFFSFIGMDRSVGDERVRKVGTVATTYSWYATLMVVSLVFMASYYADIPISMPRFFGITLLVMVISMLAFNFYYGRKGDVD